MCRDAQVKSIRASELYAELEKDKDSSKIILIDVRTAEEQKVSPQCEREEVKQSICSRWTLLISDC